MKSIKFKNLEENGGDLPLPDLRNAHDLEAEPLRKELQRLGVPGIDSMTKAQMCGRYSQVLEHIANEGSQHPSPLNPVSIIEAAKKLGQRAA